MIKIVSRGQLGNQMFQYAFAYTLARKLHTFFVVIKMDAKDQLFYFKLNDGNKENSLSALSRTLYRLKLVIHSRLYTLLTTFVSFLCSRRFKRYNEDNWQNPELQKPEFKHRGVLRVNLKAPGGSMPVVMRLWCTKRSRYTIYRTWARRIQRG